MKKNLIKIFSVLVLALSAILICVFSIGAEKETYTIQYIANGVVQQKETVAAGGSHVVRSTKLSATQTGKTFYGWYTSQGQFYSGNSLGMKLTSVNSNITFYEAYGKGVNTAEEFKNLASQRGPGNYIRLFENITIKETIKLPDNGYVIIDLNNYALTLNTDGNAFEGKNTNIHIIDSSAKHLGSIVHNSSNTSPYATNALFSFSPSGLTSDVEFKVFAPYGDTPAINISTNVGFVNVATDISSSDYTYRFDLCTNLTASHLVHSSGMKNATLDVDEISSMNFSGSRIFEDIGSNDGKVLTFNLDSGKYTLAGKTTFTNEQSRYNIYITGGSFNRNIKELFENGNYSFKQNLNTGLYDFEKCTHSGVAIDIKATCTESGNIVYQCKYCNEVYSENSSALGHTVRKELTKEAVATPEASEPGYYSTTCVRCGHTEIEYFYPQAKDVYVSVGLKDGTVLRVPATKLFGEDIDKKIQSYTPSWVENTYNVTRQDIVSIEIPLGIETIAGGTGTDGAILSVFHQNAYLEEIVLPQSLKTIGSYAFYQMPKLKSVKGLEYVSESIGEHAFHQNADTELYVENMVLNAKTIGNQAFKNVRMKTLYFGKAVYTINGSAFALDSSLESVLVEIFVEENTDRNYTKLSEIKNAFSTVSSGHQFDNQSIVFVGHDYTTETHLPTCQEQGFDDNYCRRCGIQTIDNYTEIIDHDFAQTVTKESSCAGQGEILKKCSMCEETKHESWLPAAPNNHVYRGKQYYYSANSTQRITDICTQSYRIVDVCECELLPNWQSVLTNGGTHKPTGDHDLDRSVLLDHKENTCVQDGYEVYKCKLCNTEVTEELKATGAHDWSRTGEVEATCSTPGELIYECSVCSAKRNPPTKTPIDMQNHTWGEWVTTKEPTPEATGLRQRKCSGCEKVESDVLSNNSLIKEEEEKENKGVMIALIVGGSILGVALIVILIYFTLFKKNPARKHKYNFDSYRTRRD